MWPHCAELSEIPHLTSEQPYEEVIVILQKRKGGERSSLLAQGTWLTVGSVFFELRSS